MTPTSELDPKNFSHEPENGERPLDGEVEADGTQPFMEKLIGDGGFVMLERDLSGEEKIQGVTVDTSMSGNRTLIFDRERTDTTEKATAQEFIDHLNRSGKEGLKGTRFEWFFEQEDEAFLKDLVRLLESRIAEIDEGNSVSSLKSAGFSEKLVSAAAAFREMAKRQEIRQSIDQQMPKIPFIAFEARLSPGQQDSRADDNGVVRLTFDPNNPQAADNEVEVMFVKSKSDEYELIVSCKNPNKYQAIRPVMAGAEKAKESRQYKITDGSFQRVNDTQKDGKDYSRFEFDLERGSAGTDPLFSKVKVMIKPINMDEALDEYLKHKNEAEEKKRKAEEAKQARAQQAQYSPPAPSVPSTPSQNRWQQPSSNSYVRSG